MAKKKDDSPGSHRLYFFKFYCRKKFKERNSFVNNNKSL